MAAVSDHLPQVIHVDKEKCVNCHACIAACPVKICNDGSGAYVNLNADTCIACGRCLAACTHGARYWTDDLSQFLEDVGKGQPTIAIVAPSTAASFPQRHLQLNGWLRSLGVEAVFDVTLGAELCAKSYAAHLLGAAPRLVIAQPCAAIVTYIQVHRPELLPYLAPIDSPMVHTMKMVRRWFPQYRRHRIAVISPCPAKKREFVETGWGDYNVTHASIRARLQAEGVTLDDYPAVEFQAPSPAIAALFPMPGGLLRALERHCPGIGRRARTIQGQELVYEYLATLTTTLHTHPDAAPQLIDCLNCEHGCNCGPASVNAGRGVDAVEHWVQQRHQRLESRAGCRETDRALAQYWEEGAYARTYVDRSANHATRQPNEEERQAILRSMHKYSEKDLYNCCSCGYGSCAEMTVAIHNGLNRPENCHHYLAKETEISERELAKCRDHLENLVEARTAELTAANERLRCEVFDRMRIENDLLDSRQVLSDVVHGSPIPQFVIDKNHRVIYWNKALEEFSEIKAADVLGTNEHWRAFYPEERPCLVDLLLADDVTSIAQLYRGRYHKSTLLAGAYEATDFFPKLGGQGRWLFFTAAAIKDSKGTIVGAVETLEDITARRQTEIQLARSQQTAEAANRAKSEFLANMSHEIRTPMTAIMGYVDLLSERCQHRCAPQDPRLGDPLRVISQNARHLLQLIDDVLDLSKVEAGKFEVQRTTYSVFTLLDEVVSLMSVRSGAKGLSLDVKHDGPLPATIQTDPARLRQILINIVGNAIKFTDSGGVRVTARLQDPRGAATLQLEVADTGIGIPEDSLQRLFKPFMQADASTSRKYGGTGLGLAISLRLAELLGGSIAVRSQPGKGSTFTISLPVGPLDNVPLVDAAGRGHAAAAVAGAVCAVPRKSPSIPCQLLLAEDGPDNQRLIAFLLRRAGASVSVAENGKTALLLALTAAQEGRPFDIVLMDMQMPIMDGYEATRRLRDAGYAGPIIALTAHAMTGDRQKCLSAGCDDYLTKPIDRDRLLQVVSEHLSDVAITEVC